MREIEFRAVAKNKKQWIYGDLTHDGTGYSIITEYTEKVEEQK